MSIIRVAKRARWTSIARETINDERLSFRARGVLAWFLDKPDDWESDSTTVARAAPEGRDAVRTVFKELRKYGYMKQRKDRLDDGTFVTVTEIYERPVDVPDEGETAGQTGDGLPGAGRTDAGPANAGGPADGFSGALSSTETEDEDKAPPAARSAPSTAEVRQVFDAWIESTGKTGRTQLDQKRKRLIVNALKAYPIADVLDAVRGWRKSPHHRGENDAGVEYNDLGLLLRNAEKIEKFRDLERGAPPQARGKPGPGRVNPSDPDKCPKCGRVLDLCTCASAPVKVAR